MPGARGIGRCCTAPIPRLRLEELMRAREPLYREIADLHVSTDQRRVRSVAENIMQQYKVALRQPTASANG